MVEAKARRTIYIGAPEPEFLDDIEVALPQRVKTVNFEDVEAPKEPEDPLLGWSDGALTVRDTWHIPSFQRVEALKLERWRHRSFSAKMHQSRPSRHGEAV